MDRVQGGENLWQRDRHQAKTSLATDKVRWFALPGYTRITRMHNCKSMSSGLRGVILDALVAMPSLMRRWPAQQDSESDPSRQGRWERLPIAG